MKDVNSLSHTKWNCKYYVVFVSKYRKKAFYGLELCYLLFLAMEKVEIFKRSAFCNLLVTLPVL